MEQTESMMEPIEIPLEDVLDLHMFRPQDVPDLVVHYLDECREKGILSVRLIHGKGRGVLRDRVHAILQRHAGVINYRYPAPSEAGGWGATSVDLKPVEQ